MGGHRGCGVRRWQLHGAQRYDRTERSDRPDHHTGGGNADVSSVACRDRVHPLDHAARQPEPTRPLDADRSHLVYVADPDAGESAVAQRTTFFAPADGTVTSVLGGTGSDSKVFVRVTSTITYYLDHVILDAALTPGTMLTAGQRLGTTGGAYAVDLGVVNTALTRGGLVNPSRYPDQTIHADAPLKYFEEPLRSQLYARVQCIGADRDGNIDFDIAGRLSGNWFSEAGGTAAVSFAYDTYDPSQVRLSIGGIVGAPAVYAIAAGDPFPRDVSTASGKVRYTLTRSRTGPPVAGTPVGQLLVQMVDAQRIQAEIILSQAPAMDFSSSARFLIR